MYVMEADTGEHRLAIQAKGGDQDALAQLVERTRLYLFATAYSLLRNYDDAQDAVASGLVQICQHVGDVQNPGLMRVWMRTVVHNEARRILRKRGRRAEQPVREESGATGGDARTSGLRLDILAALRQLPREEAHAVALFYLTGLPISEIARRSGRPEGTIKRWLHLGRRRLARTMEGYAPMAPHAAIISTDLDAAHLKLVRNALKAAGFSEVLTLNTLDPLAQIGTDRNVEFHLPDPLGSARLVVLDEWVGGRSAFELYSVLKAAAEAKDMAFCLLLASPTDSTVFAAWAAGFDLCLAKENLDAAEFQRLVERCLKQPTDRRPAG
jgi:RNA polymerase sigma factor (sigma-70 family)